MQTRYSTRKLLPTVKVGTQSVGDVSVSLVFGSACRHATMLTSVSEHTVIQWYQYFRDACSWYLDNFCQQIGGPGHVVHVDESVMVKRKYGRGRQAAERWVFADGTSNGIWFVDRRMAAVLLPVIQEIVIPGTGTVNHSQTFDWIENYNWMDLAVDWTRDNPVVSLSVMSPVTCQ